MKKIRAFLNSAHGRLAEHYLIVFAGTAVMAAFASSQNLDGVHGIHAVAAAIIGVGSVALKAGYDAVRQLAVPALVGWFSSRGVKPPAPVPAPAVAAKPAGKKPAAKKTPQAK